MFCTFSLPNVLFTTAACNFSTSELQKVLRAPHVLYIFTSNVLFETAACNFSTSELKKCSETDVFCTFSLPNVLFTTAACNFSTSELQKVLRAPHVLCIFTSKCAFRHSGVQFLIHPLTTWLRTRRFNRPTFGLTRHTNHWKNTAFRDFSNIWRGCIFFLLTFALLHLSADLTTLLCFSTVHIVGSFYLNFLRLMNTHTHLIIFMIPRLFDDIQTSPPIIPSSIAMAQQWSPGFPEASTNGGWAMRSVAKQSHQRWAPKPHSNSCAKKCVPGLFGTGFFFHLDVPGRKLGSLVRINGL